MTTIQMFPNAVQRAVCLFLAAVIVSCGLAAGAFGAQLVERNAAAEYAQRA